MRRILILCMTLFIAQLALAQDIILLQDATEIRAKVEEITDEVVIYRHWDSGDDAQYQLLFKDVFMITYANGEKETFAERMEQNEDRVLQNYPYPPVSRAYSVGELFDEQGVRGVVIKTTDGGWHGLILSLEESPVGTVWDAAPVTMYYLGVKNPDDGYENMRTLEKIIHKNHLTWGDFPAFEYCRKLGPGWYLPAINELMCVWNLVGGVPKTQTKIKSAMEKVSAAVVAAGGRYMNASYHINYLSSTEFNAGRVFHLTYRRPKKPLEYGKMKRCDNDFLSFKQNYTHHTILADFHYRVCVRAVHKF